MNRAKLLIVAGVIFMLAGGAGYTTNGVIGGAPFLIGIALIVVGRKKMRGES